MNGQIITIETWLNPTSMNYVHKFEHRLMIKDWQELYENTQHLQTDIGIDFQSYPRRHSDDALIRYNHIVIKQTLVDKGQMNTHQNMDSLNN